MRLSYEFGPPVLLAHFDSLLTWPDTLLGFVNSIPAMFTFWPPPWRPPFDALYLRFLLASSSCRWLPIAAATGRAERPRPAFRSRAAGYFGWHSSPLVASLLDGLNAFVIARFGPRDRTHLCGRNRQTACHSAVSSTASTDRASGRTSGAEQRPDLLGHPE